MESVISKTVEIRIIFISNEICIELDVMLEYSAETHAKCYPSKVSVLENMWGMFGISSLILVL